MWSQPRNTIRALAFSKPTFGVYYLVVLYAVQGFFFFANWWSLGVRTHYPFYLGFGLLLSPLIGICWLYLMGEFFYLLGRLFKGTASRLQIRSALAWSTIPYSITLLMWLLLLFRSPDHVFIQDSGPHSSIFINSVTLIAKTWSFVLLVQSLREVQHFSLRISLLNVISISIFSSILFFFAFSFIRPLVI